MAEQVLSAYEPSLRDRLAWAVSDLLGGDNRSRRNYLNEKVRGAVDFVPGLGDAVGVDEVKRDVEAGNYGSAAVNGILSAVGTVPGAGDAIAAGGKAMVLGLGAKNIDMGKLNKFADIVGLGQPTPKSYDRDEALKDVGFFEGDEGMPRWQISDKDASFNFPIENMHQMGPMRLSRALNHPELFKNYPQLADIEVEFKPGSAAGGAFWVPNSANGAPHIPRIEILSGAKPPAGQGLEQDAFDEKAILLHELQHAIQNLEGWDPGFSPNHPLAQLMGEETRQVGKDLVSLFPGSAAMWAENVGFPAGDKIAMQRAWIAAHPERRNELNFVRNMQAGPLKNWGNPFLGYHVKSGEHEARNTARRRNMSLDELTERGPWATEDVPSIFRMTDSDIQRMMIRNSVDDDPFEPPELAQSTWGIAFHGSTGDKWRDTLKKWGVE